MEFYNFRLQIFEGNRDGNGITRNELPKPVVARYVGINPVFWSGIDICLRTELYGCPIDTKL